MAQHGSDSPQPYYGDNAGQQPYPPNQQPNYPPQPNPEPGNQGPSQPYYPPQPNPEQVPPHSSPGMASANPEQPYQGTWPAQGPTPQQPGYPQQQSYEQGGYPQQQPPLQQGGYPPQQQGGYPQPGYTPPPPPQQPVHTPAQSTGWTENSQTPYGHPSAPVSASPVSGHPVTSLPASGHGPGMVGGQPPGPLVGSPKRPKKFLWTMVTICVVLAVAFGASAYFFYFSGDAPETVVTNYVERVAAQDYVGARELICDNASEGVSLSGPAEGLEATRRFFDPENQTWSVRNVNTDGKESVVTGDVRLEMPHYSGPIDMRWDFQLERESGAWKLCRVQMMTIVNADRYVPGECVEFSGFEVSIQYCDEPGVYIITMAVDATKQCPDGTVDRLESTQEKILCLEASPY